MSFNRILKGAGHGRVLGSAATTKQRFTDCSKKNPRPEPRNGWRHSRSRISRRNPRLQLSHGGDGCEPRRATSSFSFYGLWASCVGEFCWSPLRAAARDCYSRRDGTAFSAGLKKCSKEREL